MGFEYMVVKWLVTDNANDVEHLLNNGWTLVGGVSVALVDNGNPSYQFSKVYCFQALMKKN